MHIAFIDESFTDNHYFMGAFIIAIPDLIKLENQISQLKLQIAVEFDFEIEEDFEIHGSDLYTNSKLWRKLQLNQPYRNWMIKKFMEIAISSGGKFIFQGVERTNLINRYTFPENPQTLIFKFLVERIQEGLNSIDSHCVLICDTRNSGSEHAQMRKDFHDLKNFGSKGNFPKSIDRIADTLHFVSSKDSVGIQISDLATYLHRRRFAVPARNQIEKEFMDDIWKIYGSHILRQHIWSP